ncbi:MAG: prepilin-type N-terminal cleavage/methylation domain-containing protein [Firmicutes bacterium]|nr:prepilin-type N-terminal cleavage/methylation domain-containing protein [Bacillota bacterium]
MKTVIGNIKGLTLPELLVVMFLIALVLAVIYPLFFFGSDSFALSRDRYRQQSDARIAAETIVEHVRHAVEVEIIPYAEAVDSSKQQNGYHYFYLVDGKLYHSHFAEDESSHQIKVYEVALENHEKLFVKAEENVLGINLTAQQQKQQFKVETEIFLPNLARAQTGIVDKTGESEWKGLKYRSK